MTWVELNPLSKRNRLLRIINRNSTPVTRKARAIVLTIIKRNKDIERLVASMTNGVPLPVYYIGLK